MLSLFVFPLCKPLPDLPSFIGRYRFLPPSQYTTDTYAPSRSKPPSSSNTSFAFELKSFAQPPAIVLSFNSGGFVSIIMFFAKGIRSLYCDGILSLEPSIVIFEIFLSFSPPHIIASSSKTKFPLLSSLPAKSIL